MRTRKKFLASLSTVALGAAGIAASSQAAQAQDDAFFGLVSQLAEACLVEDDAGEFFVGQSEPRRAQCCAVIRQVGPENIDFLQAVALGNRFDPRLLVLDDELVEVLLSCQQEAVDRLAEIALNTTPEAGPGANGLYIG